MSVKMETNVDQEDFWEELSTDSASLTSTPKTTVIRNSVSSGVGSSVSDSLTFDNSFERAVYVATTTDLPPSLPKGNLWRIAGGALLMFLSIVSFVYTPYELLMNERLRMIPGFPPYDWWVEPPDEVLLKVYIFNVTNSEDFMTGNASRLIMEQIGPFVYQEKLIHTDIVFNDNGTMSYTAHRSAIFQQHLTNISRDDIIIVPNLAILGGASYLSDASFITKMGFNMMVRRVGSSPLTKISVQDYMWNWTDPLIGVARKFVPSMVPVENMGILQRIYSDFVDRVTVNIGTENPRNFFLIDKFRGSDRLGYWDGEKCDSLKGSTEGVTYPQFLTRNDTIHYLRKTICRVAHLDYSRDVIQENMLAYRWELPHNTFHRPNDGSEDCFTRPGENPLPSGISDVSPCYYNFPIAISLPHFLGAVSDVEPKIMGMTPDNHDHGSYVIIEPLTGIPMESRARSQSNLVVKPLSGFSSEITRFSNMILPMFWLEYGQQGLPWYVSSLMYFTVVILPATQHWFSLFILLTGFTLFVVGFSPYGLYVLQKLPYKYHKFEKLSFGYFR